MKETEITKELKKDKIKREKKSNNMMEVRESWRSLTYDAFDPVTF